VGWELTQLQDALLGWGVPRLRDLPWRRTRDPWAVLVSEVMLQQTQVPRALASYGPFLERFPDAPSCAGAPVGDVVRAWDGLGYNRRAVNLHGAACAVAGAGAFPDTLAGLLALPGVGPYTARAVLAFAFERDAAVLDTNIARVVARVVGRPLAGREAQATADGWLVAGQAWAWNQALMDLGAGVCTARTWACDACPLAPWCAWRSHGNAPPDPAVGSAGVSGGQSRFDGSDRQGRGRLVAALRGGPVPRARVPDVTGWPSDEPRARRVAETLVRDGLAVLDEDGRYRLP
jgi:A/G-specific adenine glycosylase